MIDFDIVLSEIGGLGRYQFFLVLVCIWSMVPISCNISAVIFLGYKEPTRCALPGIDEHVESGNISEDSVKEIMLPWILDGQIHSSCTRYHYNETSCPNKTILCMLQNNETNTANRFNPVVVDCTDGHRHDHTEFVQTITTEWDLVCSRSSLNSLSTALFCFGMLVGSLVGGSIADRYGRVFTMTCATFVNVVVGVVCSFSPTFYIFIFLRFIIGASSVAIQIAMATYTVELVGKKYRPWVGLQVGVLSGLGYIILSLLAYTFRHWRTLQLVLGLIFLPFLFFAPFIPESPRLLFAHGKTKKAKNICRMMARKNGRILNEEIWAKAETIYFTENDDILVKRGCFCSGMSKHLRTLLILVKSTCLWFVSGLVFFSLSFNVGHWSGNPFLNNTLSGLVELVGCLLVVPLIKKIGRRTTIVASLIISGALILFAELVVFVFEKSQAVEVLEVSTLLVAKFTISASFNLLFLYTAELFPTEIRNTALGISTVGGRAASIVAPFLIEVQHFRSWILPVVLGATSLATAVIAWTCPETKGRAMLATIEEAEMFYKNGRNKEALLISNNNNNNDENNNSTKTYARDDERSDNSSSPASSLITFSGEESPALL